MKHFFLLLLIGSSCVLACFGQQDYTADSPYRVHAEGALVWTLGANAKVYTAPDTQALLLATLPASTPLILLERLDEAEKRQGFYTNWYRVSYAQQEGFVWGGALAVAKIEDTTSNFTFTYGLQKIRTVQHGNYEEPQLELALVATPGDSLLDSIHIAAIGTLYTQTQVQLRGNQGLAGVQQIVEVAFSDGYCGGVAATSTLLWDGKKWRKLGVLSQGFGDNHFSNAYYKYPQEHQKGSTVVELYREEGYYNQAQQPIYTLQKTQSYEWTGTQLLSVEAVSDE